MPPAETLTGPLMVPLPPRVAPPLTVTAQPEASEPGLLTRSVPAVTFKLELRVLTAVNTLSSNLNVTAGTLLVNSPGSLASGCAVTVSGGATLGGNGTINGPVSVSAGGILAPGGAYNIATLTLGTSGNALTLNGGLLLFDLNDSTIPGSTYDTIAIGGTGVLVLNGANRSE